MTPPAKRQSVAVEYIGDYEDGGQLSQGLSSNFQYPLLFYAVNLSI